MSGARSRIFDAFRALLSPAVERRLDETCVHVIVEDESRSTALCAEALGDLLGRLWRKISVQGPGAQLAISAIRAAAVSGKQPDPIIDCAGPADYEITVGAHSTDRGASNVRISGHGFIASVGAASDENGDANPIGPFLAAIFANTELFKAIFGDVAPQAPKAIPQEYMYDARGTTSTMFAAPHELVLDDVHIIGLGAVTHAFLWQLLRWPEKVSGSIVLIDPDLYDDTNGQRYAGMREQDIGRAKVAVWAERLSQAHPALSISAHTLGVHDYYAIFRPNHEVRLAVVGVDSPELRRQIALKLPLRVVNLWTDGAYAGASTHAFDGSGACLYCVYPEERDAISETERIVQQTGLTPDRVQYLLDTSSPLTVEDVAVIQKKFQDDVSLIEGHPLRTVVNRLCAHAPIEAEPGHVTDVPFAPVSAYAGVIGFVAFLAILSGQDHTTDWQTQIFAYPTYHSWSRSSARPHCFLCSDNTVARLVRERYYPNR